MKKILCALVILLSLSSSAVFATVYFVSTTGNDTNLGTSLATPFRSIARAATVANPGDTIWVRGGTYATTARINLSRNGTAAAPIHLRAYPGDARPLLDFSSMAVSSSNRGIQLSANYWVVYGLDVFKAGDNGMHVSGAFNLIEFCTFSENADTGLQLANGANNNTILNCDSYFNKDATDGNADGFAVKLDVGTGNFFKGCRAWQNSDDGWDGLLDDAFTGSISTRYDSCWCFSNGYLKTGVASAGNGNGFKTGGGGVTGARKNHDALLTNCLAAFNRVKGFDQNNNGGSMQFFNCTGYRNSPNFGLNNNDPNAGKVMELKNCVSFAGNSNDAIRSVAVRSNNSWQLAGGNATAADFASVDSAGLRAPRSADGKLPVLNFLRPVTNGRLIDAGTLVGQPYYGSAPDIGYLELVQGTLPLSKGVLSASFDGKNVQLRWQDLHGNAQSGTQLLERSADGRNWQAMAGRPVRPSNSDWLLADEMPVQLGWQVAYYRVVEKGVTGSEQYSAVVRVVLGASAHQLQVLPNPVQQGAQLQFYLPKPSSLSIQLFDGNGRCFFTLAEKLFAAGQHSLALPIGHLPAGIYQLQLKGANGNSTLAVKKM